MPRYYSPSTESLAEVACSVTCCCIWMVCMVFTIVPGFLLVVIGCPCTSEPLSDEDLCIDCAIIGDILLSVGGSVMIVGFLYYVCNHFLLRKNLEPHPLREHVEGTRKNTGTPSVSFNPSCQLHTYEVNENSDFESSYEPLKNSEGPNNKEQVSALKSITKKAKSREVKTVDNYLTVEQGLEPCSAERGSLMSSHFSDTILNACDDRELSSECV